MNGEIKKAISANALLSLLEPSEQQALAAVAHLQSFTKGQTIYEEGKPAAEIWVVASGQVKIVKFSEGGQALALELMIAPEPALPVDHTAQSPSLSKIRLIFE